MSDAQAQEKLDEARRMVALWKKARSCGRQYIEAWSRIVHQEPFEAARRILEADPGWLDAMFQNTPFKLDHAPIGKK